MLGYAYAVAGKRTQALLHIALTYVGLGEKDQALAWLEKAYNAHDRELVRLKVGPLWGPLRPDPRFQSLLRRMNLPE